MNASWGNRLWLVLAALAIFLGAFLLFQVELLMTKMILPWFGGSAAVWVSSLMFFQVALLGGYFYAHTLVNRVASVWRTRVHIALLLVSLAFIPIVPAEFWKPTSGQNPLPLILGLLTATIGLPFLLLSSATPLLQAWIGAATVRQTDGAPSHAIYRLYALSNLGSMLALLSYPVLVEPLLTTKLQAWLWSSAYALFVVLYIAAAWRNRAAPLGFADAADRGALGAPSISPRDRYLWFLLPLAASALLLALTNHALRNIAPIPLFWTVPLAIYLLSFIICFDHPRWYYRPLWLALFGITVIGMCIVLGLAVQPNLRAISLGFWLVGLFVSCMVCHGELVRLKPSPRYLTSYYLTIAGGGAAGGILIAVIAPLVFPADFDLPILVTGTASLIIALFWRPPYAARTHKATEMTLIGAATLLVAATVYMARGQYNNVANGIYFERNFYGALRVEDEDAVRRLMNGTIIHGAELANFGAGQPVSYYSQTSGVGLVLGELARRGPLKVGMIGLGAGTIAGYARDGDHYRFYEINPAVPPIAKSYFHYLDACKSGCDITLGDARLSLEREEPQQFDLLAVDAFTSDSIPVHLLTREAFALYWRHLKPNGVLAIHVTNSYIDLAPLVASITEPEGKITRVFTDFARGDAVYTTAWVLATADTALFEQPALKNGLQITIPGNFKAWTDDYSNLWQSVR